MSLLSPPYPLRHRTEETHPSANLHPPSTELRAPARRADGWYLPRGGPLTNDRERRSAGTTSSTTAYGTPPSQPHEQLFVDRGRNSDDNQEASTTTAVN